MADNQKLEQMLEHLINDEQDKAEELFHEYVVAKSREIYESLIDSEISEEEESDEDEEEMEEAAADDEAEEDKVDEEFEDIAIEADDEMDGMGGDATDDLEAELDAEQDDEEEKDPEELFQDLDAIVDELQAKFDALKGEEGSEMGGEEEMKDSFGMEDQGEADLETVREYVEKVGAGHGAEKKGAGESAGTHTKSTVAGKNDMGGTTANIAKGGEGSEKGTAGGLLNPATKEDSAGNVNVPGSKNATKMSSVAKGHGAEKSGAKEDGSVNKTSLFRK